MRAAEIPNDLECRQALHREVNELPNANYATLRFLILVCVFPHYLQSTFSFCGFWAVVRHMSNSRDLS